MGTIIAIGGGELSSESGHYLHSEIIKHSKSNNPKVLFIPTASYDNKDYIISFKNMFEKKLSCKVDVLSLVERNYNSEEIEEMIFSSDIIYVGGGNTDYMMSVWRHYSLDKLLIEAFDRGIVLSGLSAGAVCWFDFIQSGMDSYESTETDSYKRLDGLGLIRGYGCSHFNQKSRNSSFQEMIYNYKGEGFGICDNSALIYKDGNYKVITTDNRKGVYKVVYSDSFVKKMKLQLNIDFMNYVSAVDRT
jgi:dipeptidase E